VGDEGYVVQLDAGRYSLELRAPSDFSGRVTVKVEETLPCTPLPGEPCTDHAQVVEKHPTTQFTTGLVELSPGS
jgi:hypothetical protein